MPETNTVLPGGADGGQRALHAFENGVVAAAGAPANFLVGLEVLEGQFSSLLTS